MTLKFNEIAKAWSSFVKLQTKNKHVMFNNHISDITLLCTITLETR